MKVACFIWTEGWIFPQSLGSAIAVFSIYRLASQGNFVGNENATTWSCWGGGKETGEKGGGAGKGQGQVCASNRPNVFASITSKKLLDLVICTTTLSQVLLASFCPLRRLDFWTRRAYQRGFVTFGKSSPACSKIVRTKHPVARDAHDGFLLVTVMLNE